MKKILPLICLIVIVGLIAPIVALASYAYYIPIQFYNNNSDAMTGVPILVTLNNSQLVDLGYISSSGLDTEVQEGSTPREFLVADARLGIFLPSLLGYQLKTVNYRLGESPGQDNFPLIVGGGGSITIENSTSLRLGWAFTIELYGWINTTAGSDKNIIYKQDAFKLYVQAEDTIRAAVLGAGDSENKTVTVSDLDSQVLKISVVADSVNMTLSVWDVSGTSLGTHTTVLEGASVPDNSNSWYLVQNNSVAYLEYLKIKV